MVVNMRRKYFPPTEKEIRSAYAEMLTGREDLTDEEVDKIIAEDDEFVKNNPPESTSGIEEDEQILLDQNWKAKRFGESINE